LEQIVKESNASIPLDPQSQHHDNSAETALIQKAGDNNQNTGNFGVWSNNSETMQLKQFNFSKEKFSKKQRD
jgi:hypothetical protein